MEYVRCERCEINYKLVTEEFCMICKDELKGIRTDDYESNEDLICPFCEKGQMDYGEEMCAACKSKKEKSNTALS